MSCVCKTVEHMINCWFIWILENEDLSSAKCGFVTI